MKNTIGNIILSWDLYKATYGILRELEILVKEMTNYKRLYYYIAGYKTTLTKDSEEMVYKKLEYSLGKLVVEENRDGLKILIHALVRSCKSDPDAGIALVTGPSGVGKDFMIKAVVEAIGLTQETLNAVTLTNNMWMRDIFYGCNQVKVALKDRVIIIDEFDKCLFNTDQNNAYYFLSLLEGDHAFYIHDSFFGWRNKVTKQDTNFVLTGSFSECKVSDDTTITREELVKHHVVKDLVRRLDHIITIKPPSPEAVLEILNKNIQTYKNKLQVNGITEKAQKLIVKKGLETGFYVHGLHIVCTTLHDAQITKKSQKFHTLDVDNEDRFLFASEDSSEAMLCDMRTVSDVLVGQDSWSEEG